jgi:hypothetical protein
MNNSNSSEIDSIIQELKAEEIQHVATTETKKSDTFNSINDENVNEYVYKKSSELVESTLNAVSILKDTVVTGSDPKEIAALAQLINAASKSLDQLNKINIQNKTNKNNMEMKKMEIESNANRPALPNTTNVVIATRDEIMKQLFDKPSAGKKNTVELIEGDFEKK